MNLTKPQAIIFDMDGLLVDSESTWFVAETEVIEARGYVYTKEVRAHVVGKRMDEFLVALHEIYNFQDSLDSLMSEITERMMRLIPVHTKPQPGAHEIVSYVQQSGIPTAIASSSPMTIIDAIVQSQGWESVFQVRCTADDEAFGKPAPDVYLRAAERLGVKPVDCLALEDSPNGARAAVAAGMTCYAVPDASHSDRHAFDGITPHVFHSLHEVLERIKAS